MENLAVSALAAGCREICSPEEEHDRQLLAELNPDYVRKQANDPNARKKMLLEKQTLQVAFKLEQNAQLWLYSQIMKCTMMSSVVAPDAEMVNNYALIIFQQYGQRPISHFQIFFGLAQVGRHFGDNEQIVHFGIFDLSRILCDLDRQLRIISYKRVITQQKIDRIDFQIQMCDELIDGRVKYPNEQAARDPSNERHNRLSQKEIAFFNSDEWEIVKRTQVENAKLERERLRRQRYEVTGE